MKAIIMAGGEGTRLRSVTGELPKPMVPLLGKPLMERIVELLRRCGFGEICVSLRYHPRPITEYFGDGSRFGVRMEYRLEREPLGTAGGVKNCADFCGGDDFLVISGDAACDFDLAAVMEDRRKSGAAVTMALRGEAAPLRYGLVVPDTEGRVRCFIEKPGWERVVTDLVNTGIYALSPRAMEAVPAGVPFDFARDLFPLLLARGELIRGVQPEGYWCDVGTPRAYYQCCLDALSGTLRLPDAPPQETFSPPREARAPLPGSARVCRHVPCRDRARLMRAVSETILELGADLTDGVRLSGEKCGVRISPDPAENELLVEASSGSTEFSRELCGAAYDLARKLEKS